MLLRRGDAATDWIGVASGALRLGSSGPDGRAFTLVRSSVRREKALSSSHCERDGGGVIRIISARKATKHESSFYGQ